MFGGPSSGHEKLLTSRLHAEQVFKRPFPKPTKTFDDNRGASPELNSYNNLYQNMPTGSEFPRLSILQNFREINRIMTSTFLKQKMQDEKFQGRLPHDY